MFSQICVMLFDRLLKIVRPFIVDFLIYRFAKDDIVFVLLPKYDDLSCDEFLLEFNKYEPRRKGNLHKCDFGIFKNIVPVCYGMRICDYVRNVGLCEIFSSKFFDGPNIFFDRAVITYIGKKSLKRCFVEFEEYLDKSLKNVNMSI